MFHKITKKLIRYFILMITSIIFICFIVSSIFLSKFYMDNQYKKLKSNAEEIYSSLKDGNSYNNIGVNAFLIKDSTITPIGNRQMGIMRLFRTINISDLKTKGSIKIHNKNTFIYYNLNTELGNIFVFQDKKSSSEYLKIIYLVLLSVFILTILISIPLISHFGRKFTEPILCLKKASQEISKGNFNTEINIKTNDEIEELSESLNVMKNSLKEKDILQKDFIANVSHDFKTPLSIIRNYSEAINDGIVEGDDVKKYSIEIINEVDRLNTLVQSIMELSKLQGGKYKLVKSKIEISNLLKECADKFKYLASSKNINLILKSQEAIIYGDRNYILRVLYNFLDNAIKFSPNNSSILLCSTINKNKVKVCVIDKGTGIEKDMLNDIWKRYYKHNKKGGMGLGLAISSEILKLHGFKYGAKSIQNKETEFYFIAPIL